MKKMRRFAAIAAAAAMTACMAVPMMAVMPASAVDGSNSIVINNEVRTHVYEAYQIFDGKLDTTTSTILSNITWGSGVNDEAEGFLVDIQGITVGEGAAVTTPFAACDSAQKVADVLAAGNYSKDAEITKKFAAVIGKYLTDDCATSNYNETDKKHVIDSLDDGYYLIQDNMGGVTGSETATRYIVEVLGVTSVEPKSSKPEMEKKVAENETSKYADEAYTQGVYTAPAEYNDVADWNIGDDVPFELIGTMPSDLAEYTKYYYQFSDTLGAGLTLNEESISVKLVSSTGTTKLVEDTHYGVNVNGQTFTITFDDIKGDGATADTVVVVDYTAELNAENAVIGLEGNPNEAKLIYSNNPNWDGSDASSTTSETPVENVIVFTYQLDVDKIAKGTTTKLKGAEFVLYRKNANDVAEYAVLVDGKVDSWTTTKTEATTLKTEKVEGQESVYQTIQVVGLDDGEYFLEETKEPDGYNLPSTPFEMTIVAGTDNSQDWDETDAAEPAKALTALTLNSSIDGTLSTGVVATSVENTMGNTLPSTGGIGTTLFYVVGGTLAAGAGVALIAKKRMKNED